MTWQSHHVLNKTWDWVYPTQDTDPQQTGMYKLCVCVYIQNPPHLFQHFWGWWNILLHPKTYKNGWSLLKYLKLVGPWFQVLFMFTPILGGNDPIWQAYFSNGLKPPTSKQLVDRNGIPRFMAIDETTGRELIQVLTVCVREVSVDFSLASDLWKDEKHGFKNQAEDENVGNLRKKTVKNHRNLSIEFQENGSLILTPTTCR